MNARNMRRQLFKQRNCCWLIVDENAALGGNFPPQDKPGIVSIHPILLKNFRDGFFGVRLELEYGRNHRAFGAEPDHIWGSFSAQKQRKGVDQHGFAGAGFASEQIQPSPKLDCDVLNHREVFKAQFDQHGCPGKKKLSAG